LTIEGFWLAVALISTGDKVIVSTISLFVEFNIKEENNGGRNIMRGIR
jgi:hypothetical protein